MLLEISTNAKKAKVITTGILGPLLISNLLSFYDIAAHY